MNKHLFIIDDDKDELYIFLEAINLIKEKIECSYASGAEQAMKMLENLTPDIIFVDENMPRINGLQCLQMIKRMPKLKNVPVILFSNGMEEKLYRQAKSFGADFCVKKTSDINVLGTMLRQLIHHNYKSASKGHVV